MDIDSSYTRPAKYNPPTASDLAREALRSLDWIEQQLPVLRLHLESVGSDDDQAALARQAETLADKLTGTLATMTLRIRDAQRAALAQGQ
jgi:hypothetical protein